MRVKNVTEELVMQNLESVIRETQPVCDCEKCRSDIAAYALNKLKPRYVTTDRGETITRAASLDNQVLMDVIAALTLAISVVGKNPRHE